MFLRFQKIALDVSYGFRQYSPLSLIEVFLINESVYIDIKVLKRDLDENNLESILQKEISCMKNGARVIYSGIIMAFSLPKTADIIPKNSAPKPWILCIS